ncbi:TBC1 domain family member 13-like [Liolophura sinensis]|uniref:TBC1 domain family member 13-like n=1 Tax=Liolophura sinensis TaxID=3198878 RepID=UPI003158C862
MAAYRARLKELQDVLQAPSIDMKKLRRLCFSGCSLETGSRSICWKLLLDYLPPDRSQWKSICGKQRAVYQQFVNELIVKPGANAHNKQGPDTPADHPLNPNPDSQWAAYFKDNEMLVQIDKDCRRLCPDLSFFQTATDYPCEEMVTLGNRVETLRKRVEQGVLKAETVARNRLGITNMMSSRKRSNSEYATLPEGQEAHWEVVERILFLYAKLNPGLGYVQGMNEILGPIYYTFASDAEKEVQENAEADAFFCFTNLMSEIRDNFIKTLDDSQCGIGYMMERMLMMLKKHDCRLFQLFETQEMKPQYFAFRWITLLLSQEFQLPDVLRVWDSLFADEKRFDFLIFVCCAMLILVRDDLLGGDFPTNMKLVQNYPSTVDVQRILSKATELSAS